MISAESFARAECRAAVAAELTRLAEREDVAVGIVGYVRPQWQYLEACYTQVIYREKLGAPTFQRFVADRLDAGGRTMLDYNVVFAPYCAAFGEGVRVLPLEPSRFPQGLPADFLRQCGIDAGPAAVAGLPRRNRRRGAKETEVRRLARAAAGPRKSLERGLGRLPLLFADAPFAGFDPSEIENIDANFAAANARFARGYGIDADGVLFRDRVDADGARRNIGCWKDFSAGERRLVRRFVLDKWGVDIDPDAGDPVAPWRVAWRLRPIRAKLRLLRRRWLRSRAATA